MSQMNILPATAASLQQPIQQQMIRLVSADEKDFIVPLSVAKQFGVLKNMLEISTETEHFDCPNVKAKELAVLLEYASMHASMLSADDLKAFDDKFVNKLVLSDKETQFEALFPIIMATNFLGNEQLLNLMCRKFADLLKNKSTEEMRKIFDVDNDFTPEEEVEIDKEMHAIFDGVDGFTRKKK